jgi:hypothetical protein
MTNPPKASSVNEELYGGTAEQDHSEQRARNIRADQEVSKLIQHVRLMQIFPLDSRHAQPLGRIGSSGFSRQTL